MGWPGHRGTVERGTSAGEDTPVLGTPSAGCRECVRTSLETGRSHYNFCLHLSVIFVIKKKINGPTILENHVAGLFKLNTRIARAQLLLSSHYANRNVCHALEGSQQSRFGWAPLPVHSRLGE